MAATGYSIAAIADVPPGDTVDNVIKDKPGVKLKSPSRVDIYLTREGVDVLFTVTVGGVNVYPAGPANINTVDGTLPSTQDDNVITCMAQASDEILIAASNANAAAQEARVLVKVLPVDDAILASAIKIRGRQT